MGKFEKNGTDGNEKNTILELENNILSSKIYIVITRKYIWRNYLFMKFWTFFESIANRVSSSIGDNL